RELMSNLKPPPSLGKGDINTSVQWVAEKMKRHDLNVSFDGNKSPEAQPDKNVRITLIQCMEELLFNVVKHADINTAGVHISYPDRHIRIRVEDEGKGFDSDKKEFRMS